MNNSPIGIFDSGIGGITILNSIKNILPNESLIYYSDNINSPYGNKTKKEIQSLVYSDTFLSKVLELDIDGKKEKVMSRIFESDMGQEASAVELEDGSLLWIRVDGIMPERVSPFEDVREKATQQWKSRERRALLEGLAEHIVSEGNKGKKFSTLAGEVGKSPITSPAVNRQTDDETFSRQAVRKLFVAKEGAFTWSQVGFGESLIVMRVAEIASAAFCIAPGRVSCPSSMWHLLMRRWALTSVAVLPGSHASADVQSPIACA